MSEPDPERALLRLEGVGCDFGGTRVIDEVDLEVHAGECVVLVGASGSGKTTLLRMMNRLLEPSRGRILFEGVDTATLPAASLRRRIGYGAQRSGLFPHWDVGRNVGVTLRLENTPREETDERVDAMLHRVGLPPETFRTRRVTTLSGGQAQRVSLARALAAAPPLLLLDEPFAALDPVSRDALQDVLVELRDALGVALIFVTHDMGEALRLADRIAFVEEGRIAQIGTPLELLHAPESDAIRDFLRAPLRQARLVQALERAPGDDA